MRRPLLVSLTSCIVFLSGYASAAPLPDDVARARAAFAEGLAEARAGDHERARASFLAAYGRIPSVDILWNLAVTEQKLGRDVDARRHLREYAAHPSARADRKEEIARELEPALARTTGEIAVRAPDGARVSVDGEAARGDEVIVAPGVHAVEVALGDRRERWAVEVAAGERVTRVAFAPAPTPAPPPAAPPTPSPPPPLVAPPPPPPRATSGGVRWAPIGLAAGAAVAIGGGVWLTTRATAASDERERLWGQMQVRASACGKSDALCADWAGARDSARRYEALAIGAYATGGALAGAAVLTWLFGGARATVAPAVGRGEVGLVAAGAL